MKPSTISTIVIVFHACVTTLGVKMLMYPLVGAPFPTELFLYLLIVDTAFIVSHLTYRYVSGAKYRGKHIRLAIMHGILSLLSLILAYACWWQSRPAGHIDPVLDMTLTVIWVVALVSGIILWQRRKQEDAEQIA